MKLLFCLGSVFAEFVDYSGYRVLRGAWTDSTVTTEIYDLLKNVESLDMWAPESLGQIFDTKSMDIMISRPDAERLTTHLSRKMESFEVLIDNVGELMDQQKPITTLTGAPGDLPYDDFLSYELYEEWLYDIAQTYPDWTELNDIGRTVEGRTMWGLHMGDGDHSGPKKKLFIGNG